MRPLGGEAVRLTAEGFKVGQCLLRLRGRMDDRGLVGAQDAEPMADIAGMAVMQLVGQPELSTAEPGTDFGDQLLESISLVAEALAEGARQAIGMSRPVPLMPISA